MQWNYRIGIVDVYNGGSHRKVKGWCEKKLEQEL
jgi:hypothetical protein